MRLEAVNVSNSIRGPQRSTDSPFVMHLERVCRLIEMGQDFTIEFHPHSDLPSSVRGMVVKKMGLRILEDGDVLMLPIGGGQTMMLGMKLANYRKIWRCWQNGTPTETQCRETWWA